MIGQTQRNFSRGELSPSLQNRVDAQQYAAAVKTARNMQVLRMGGLQSRAGTEFVAEVKYSTKTVRLIPYVYAGRSYVLEIGNQYMRVHRNGSQVLQAAHSITGITNANPAVLTYSGTDTYDNGDEVTIAFVSGAIGNFVNGRNFLVANVNTAANTFQLHYLDGTAVNSTSWGAYASGGFVAEIFEIPAVDPLGGFQFIPYLEAHLPDLMFSQNVDILTITHPSYQPREISSTADATWVVNIFLTNVNNTSANSLTNTGAAGSTTLWQVLKVMEGSFECASDITLSTGSGATPSAGVPITVSWAAATDAAYFKIFRNSFLIGYAGGNATSFVDSGQTATTESVPINRSRNLFASADNYASVVGYYQQRRILGNSNNNPDRVWMSMPGARKNFSVTFPTSSDYDGVVFSGAKLSAVNGIVDADKLVLLAPEGVFIAEGNEGGNITPTAQNLRQASKRGAALKRALLADSTVIYLQARQSAVRGYDVVKNVNRELSLFSNHLVDGYTIRDLDYQEQPHSTCWFVRSDGVALSLTHVPDQEIYGWARHDTDGTFEQVCVIPGTTEDVVYFVVKRTINGATKRYIEAMPTRIINDATDVKDLILMDSALSYDGTNSGSQTMTLSTSGGWTTTDTLTLTSSTAYFSASEVGNEIHLTGSDGEVIRFAIDAYTSTTVVTGRAANKNVPTSLQAVATATWTRAVDEVTGLWHLEGKSIAIFGDGFVVASPNNANYSAITVANGIATLPRCYGVITGGLPYTSDVESLDIDDAERSIATKKKIVRGVTLHLERTRGVWVGPKAPEDDDDDPLENLVEMKIRDLEGYDDSVDLFTGKKKINILPEWNSNGRFFIRQVDPVPMTILAMTPDGDIEGGR